MSPYGTKRELERMAMLPYGANRIQRVKHVWHAHCDASCEIKSAVHVTAMVNPWKSTGLVGPMLVSTRDTESVCVCVGGGGVPAPQHPPSMTNHSYLIFRGLKVEIRKKPALGYTVRHFFSCLVVYKSYMVYWSLGKIHYIIVSRCKEEGSLIRLINPRTVNYLFVHYEKDDGFDCNLWITSIEKPFPPIRRNTSKRTFDQNRRKYKYEHSDLHDTIQITCELILNKEYNATTKERKNQIEIKIYTKKI